MSEEAEIFAKLFDTPHGQLLAYLDEDDNEQPCVRVIGAYVRGVRPAANLGYEDEAAALEGFNRIDQAGAEEMAERFHNLADGLASCRQVLPIVLTELDANGEAMICEGCGTTQTIEAILARHGKQAIACCPERKMVQARHFWKLANEGLSAEMIRELVEALDGMMRHSCVADSAPEDKDGEDHAAESRALRILAKVRGNQ